MQAITVTLRILLTTALAALAISCSSGGGLQSGTPTGFDVQLLDGSIHGMDSDRLSHRISGTGERAVLIVEAPQDSGIRAAYMQVSFDPRAWQPESVQPLSVDGDGGEWISLAVPAGEGLLQVGLAAVGLDDSPGLARREILATLAFRRITGDGADTAPSRGAAAAPANAGSQCTLSVDQASGKLLWEYRCTGDYDQNGLVSISDLTPLGIHFGKSGPFSASNIEGVVDGDGNGEINLGDITPIGQNFGRGVEGYNIYLSETMADYPSSGAAASTISPAGSFPFSSASGTASTQRLQFVRTTLITPDRIYWVRPVHQGVEGIASTTDTSIVVAPEPPVAELTADPLTGIAPLLVTLDASGSTDANGNIDHYDWDFENDGTYDATTTVPQISRTYNGGPWTARVRVVDSGGLSDTATVNMVFTQPSWNITTVDGNAAIYRDTAMVFTGGRPVILYDQFNTEPLNDRLFVVRGTDGQGSSWTAPTRLDLQLEDVGDLDMDIVDGRAAACYYDAGNERFRFIRSNSEDSSSWGSPITLETDDSSLSTYGKDCSLEVIDGVPAVAFRGDSQLHIYYKVANDATGSSWGTRVLVSPGLINVGGITLLDAGGRPGILWSSIIQQKVGYIRSNELTGQFFNTDLYDGTPQLTQDLVYHQGQPLALFITGTPTFDARVAVASEPDGSSWETPQIIGPSSQNGCSIAVINGIPMAMVTNTEAGSKSYLMFYRALDPSGSSWSDPETVDGGSNQIIASPSLIEISGAPAVSYAWSEHPTYELRYAIYF